MDQPARPTTYINSLTSTRAIAAILVVIHHYGRGLAPFSKTKNLFQSGNLAVSYFFVLSGFVLFLAHFNKQDGYIQFLRKRAGRLFPLYYFALFFTLALTFIQGTAPPNIGQQTLYATLLIQSWIPGYALTLNTPAWSISVEMLFYVSFPLLLMLLRNNLRLFVAIYAIAFIAAQALHLHYFEQRYSLPDGIVDPLFFGPYTHISQFMAGMLGGYIFTKIKDKAHWPWYVPLAVAAATAFVIELRPNSISYHVGLIAPLFLLLIIAIAKTRTPILDKPAFVFLGEISYGIYILQFPVFMAVDMLQARLFPGISSAADFSLSLFLLIALSALLYKTVEQPLRRWISGTK